ncbi:hypothetical protein IM25_24990 (plasmid) [Rhodococcus sp. p52]|uniref:hypothetical protein n=1 Tax=Rhodococcus TaxID=1827 RepID=UPI00051B87A4|nr:MULTISPECIES: hypothetical protein [Rhodococcus]AOD24988.1 hypothetical protein IM25_24990 [Rhodococcus sp. p52]MBX4171681.1 hypothetical protein [Rhodococcus sp. DMU2021]UPK66519.1 hypothetical protein MYP14_25170 [Rhodococcus pyridinivorans]
MQNTENPWQQCYQGLGVFESEAGAADFSGASAGSCGKFLSDLLGRHLVGEASKREADYSGPVRVDLGLTSPSCSFDVL